MQKSLKTLRSKLEMLAEHAKFRVRINCVLGSSPAEEAVEVARTAIALGFDVSTSLPRGARSRPRSTRAGSTGCAGRAAHRWCSRRRGSTGSGLSANAMPIEGTDVRAVRAQLKELAAKLGELRGLL